MNCNHSLRVFNRTFAWLLPLVFLGMGGGILHAADVQFSASVDRNVLSLNDLLTLTIKIEGAGLSAPTPQLPELTDFQILSGPNQSSSFQFINGRTSSSKTYSYRVRPAREGTLTIGAAELTYEGKIYRTEPITITVSSSSGSAPPPSPAKPVTSPPRTVQGQDADVFISVDADKSQVFQGEQVIVTYTLYTRVSVNGYEISKLPSAQGFWVEEFPIPQGGPQVRDAVINGQHYRAAVVRQVALFPTQSGTSNVDPLEVNCQVQVMDQQRRSRDPFDLLFDSPFNRYRTEELALRSDPLNLRVLPLPQEGRPVNFSGAVGQYNLDVSLDRPQTRTNEALTMTVRFRGTGNLKMLPPPNFRAPSDFESYEPKESVQVDKSHGRITGTKTYEYVLIPRFAGEQKIPAISFSYFNPTTRSYESITRGGFVVSVQQGSSAPNVTAPGIAKEDVKLLGQDIHYLKPVGKLRPLAVATSVPGLLRWGMALPPVLLMLFFALNRRLGHPSFQAKRHGRRAFQRALTSLRRLEKFTPTATDSKNPGTNLYTELHRLLLTYLGERLKLPVQGLKEQEVIEELSRREVSEELITQVNEIFHTCNFARFAPGNQVPAQLNQLLSDAKTLLTNLENHWEKSV